MKSHTRLLVSILTIAMVANATGCSKKMENNNEESKNDISIEEGFGYDIGDHKVHDEIIITDSNTEEETNPDIVEDANISETQVIEKSLEEILYERLYDENIDYNFVINNYLNTDYCERSELTNDYLRALYMLLYNSNNMMINYLKELNTMAIMQQIPMCVPEDIWNTEFANLLILLNGYESLFEKFGPLAFYVHDIECEHEHIFDDCDCYTCPGLQEEYKLLLKLEPKNI